MKKESYLPKIQFRANTKHLIGLPFDLGEFNYQRVLKYVAENPDCLFSLEPILPESRKQRRYFEGALVSLFVFYNGGDYHDRRVLEDAREDLKREFWAELRMNWVTNTLERKPKSTKGRVALQTVVERVYSYLVEHYAVPEQALDPATYKKWRDIELIKGAPYNYLDYLLQLKIITRP